MSVLSIFKFFSQCVSLVEELGEAGCGRNDNVFLRIISPTDGSVYLV